jgi:hypothetical protein
MVLRVVIDTGKDQGVFSIPGKKTAGHTCEYAQHDQVYQRFAFHSPKGTNIFGAAKILA